MATKKLTIHIKTSNLAKQSFYKFNVNCYCGRCIMPECTGCQNCCCCNVVAALRHSGMIVWHDPNTADNRQAVVVTQSVRMVEAAYNAAFSAIRLCNCVPKKKTK